MKHIICALLLLGSMQAAAQQKNGRISGTVTDAAGKPLHLVTATLLKGASTALVKVSVTDKEGRYEFINIADGDYVVSFSGVGLEKQQSERLTVSGGAAQHRLKTVAMLPEIKKMGDVTVTSRRPFIETKIDKTVVNVDASPTSAGTTALELLEKSPGVMVSNDGAISLRGKQGVIIMIDGKPTFLSPADLSNLLKNMPASALEQIEIMTNPSAKYDASGNSGVINIKTKKGKSAGFNGSVMAGFTTSYFESPSGTFYVMPKSQNSINFNYRKNRVNFYGSYNPNVFRGRNFMDISRTKLDDSKNILGYNDVETQFQFGNNNHTLKLGLDIFADKKNSFGMAISGFLFNGHPTPTTTTVSSDAAYRPVSGLVSRTDNRIKQKNLTTSFNYRHQFDSTGRELTADFDFIKYDNVSAMTLTTDIFNGAWQQAGDPLVLKGNLPAGINIYSFKTDYVHPVRGGGRIETGVKSSYVTNDNLVSYVRWENNKWVNDSRSNHFIYDENINAAYINANTKKGKWSLQGGLRVENTIAKGYQVTNDSTFRRNFTNLFPSAFISYAVDNRHQLTVSYTRRVNRPNYQDLNPFIYFLDSLSYRKGNPFLLPQFSHNMELSHAFKGRLITTLNYSITNNVISQILKAEGDLVFLTADNVSRFRNMGIAVTAPVPVTKWWNANLFMNVFNNRFDGVFENQPINLSFTSYLINLTQTFSLKKGLTLEMSGFYRAKGVQQLNVDDAMYVISFGAQKQVMKGRGTVRINLRDPFWLQRYRGTTKYNLIDTRVDNRWDNRQVTTSFTWRFGKTQQNQRRRSSASQEEQNRVGQGGQ